MSRVQYLLEMDSDLKELIQLAARELKEAGAKESSVRSVIHGVLREYLDAWKTGEHKRLEGPVSREGSAPGMKAYTVTLTEGRKGISRSIPMSIVGGVPALRIESGDAFGDIFRDLFDGNSKRDEQGTFGSISVDPRVVRAATRGSLPGIERASLAAASDGLWLRPPRKEDAGRALVYVEKFWVAARTRPFGDGVKLVLGSEEGRGNFLVVLEPTSQIVIERPAHHDPKPLITVHWDGTDLLWSQAEYPENPTGDMQITYL